MSSSNTETVRDALAEIGKHYPVVDYVLVICACGDRSDTRREFEQHRERVVTAAQAVVDAVLADAHAAVERVLADRVELALDAWDDGNATGLDGWVGPMRGTTPVDEEAIRARWKFAERARRRPEVGVASSREL